jgi:hypothetical protein
MTSCIDGELRELVPLDGRGAGEELVEEYAEGIDIGAGVDVDGVGLGLLGAHVLGGADELSVLGEEGLLRQTVVDGLGDAEVDDLGGGFAVVGEGDEDVGGFEVAVNDALVVGVLDGLADGHEEPESLAGACRSSR